MKHRNALIIIIAALTVARLLYIAYTPFDLSPDEAHYWEWSRRLDLSYYSKGPLVAYIIAFFTTVFGNTAFAVRAGAVIFSSLAAYMMYLLGKDLFGSEKTGFYAALLPNLTPLFSIGSILMTTDILLVFFWVFALYCVKRALDPEKSAWWYLAGIAIGLGVLGKYTAALLYPCVFLYLIFSKKDRFWLSKREPYLAGVISLIIVIPVIYWNLKHGEVTLKHTMGQVHAGEGVFSITAPLGFLASQAALLTPLIFIALIYGVYEAAKRGFGEGGGEKNRGALLLFFVSAPVFLFFLFVAFHGKVQANWAVASYVGAMPAAVRAFEGAARGVNTGKRLLLNSVAVLCIFTGALGSFLAYFPRTLEPLGARRILDGPPYNRVTGWRKLGKKVSEVKAEMGQNSFIMSDTYQITSELAFYAKGNPVTYNADAGTRRMNQYDLWPGYGEKTGFNAIYVKGGDTEAEPVILETFNGCDKEIFTVYYNKRALKNFSIFRCRNFKGLKEKAAESKRF